MNFFSANDVHSIPQLDGAIPFSQASFKSSPPEIVAVIDAGSGNWRLVAYKRQTDTDWVRIHQEKLEVNLADHTRYRRRAILPDRFETSREVARHFHQQIQLLGVTESHIMMTGAGRAAAPSMRGQSMIETLQDDFGGRKIDVITGVYEATLLEKSLAYRHPEDLVGGGIGRGSLQLLHKASGKRIRHYSFPIGASVLLEQSGGDVEKAAHIVHRAIEYVDYGKISLFAAAGGSWRAIGRLAQKHEVDLSSWEAVHDEMLRLRDKSLHYYENRIDIIHNRAHLMGVSAAALGVAIKHFKPENGVIFSHATIREGKMLEIAEAKAKTTDPIVLLRLETPQPSSHGRQSLLLPALA